MKLADEIAMKHQLHLPSTSSWLYPRSVAAINEALERAAQECEKLRKHVGPDDCATAIRALMSGGGK